MSRDVFRYNSFDWDRRDRAIYALGDGGGAVRLARRAGRLAVDIETAGLGVDAWTVKAVSVGTTDIAVVLDPDQPSQRRAIRDALAAADVLVLHNSPFDVPILVGTGLMRPADIWKVHDTLVTARMAYPSERGGNGLADASERWLGARYGAWKHSLAQGWRETTGKTKRQMWLELGLSSPAYVAYAAFDVIMTARLDQVLPDAVRRRITDIPMSRKGDPDYLLEREQTVNRVMLARSAAGLTVDPDVVDELKGAMRRTMAEADAELAAGGVDVTLSRDLMKRDVVRVLAQQGRIPRGHPRLQNGQYSADKRALDRIGGPLVGALNRRSQADRFAHDYADKLLGLSARDGRVHPQVNVLAAVTGRSSYGEPPIQQFPPITRRMFAFDRPATSMDWSSIEPLFIAYAAGEGSMIDRFEAGGDLYLPVAEAAGVERREAKTVLLAQLYGQGVTSLAGRLGMSVEDAQDVIDRVMGAMPAVTKVAGRIKGAASSMGWVPTLSGRVVPIDRDPRSGGYFGYRGVNYYVQGSCYDILAEVIYEAHRQGLSDAIYVAVHDELVTAAEAADDIQRLMITPPAAFIELAGRVPVLRVGRTELGSHWREKDS